jgi:hypothetical protein
VSPLYPPASGGGGGFLPDYAALTTPDVSGLPLAPGAQSQTFTPAATDKWNLIIVTFELESVAGGNAKGTLTVNLGTGDQFAQAVQVSGDFAGVLLTPVALLVEPGNDYRVSTAAGAGNGAGVTEIDELPAL